jgi:hypothetical protein
VVGAPAPPRVGARKAHALGQTCHHAPDQLDRHPCAMHERARRLQPGAPAGRARPLAPRPAAGLAGGPQVAPPPPAARGPAVVGPNRPRGLQDTRAAVGRRPRVGSPRRRRGRGRGGVTRGTRGLGREARQGLGLGRPLALARGEPRVGRPLRGRRASTWRAGGQEGASPPASSHRELGGDMVRNQGDAPFPGGVTATLSQELETVGLSASWGYTTTH